jgi:hypothetical protein
MQYIVYDKSTYKLLAWIDTESEAFILANGTDILASKEDLSSCVMEPTSFRDYLMVVPEKLTYPKE